MWSECIMTYVMSVTQCFKINALVHKLITGNALEGHEIPQARTISYTQINGEINVRVDFWT